MSDAFQKRLEETGTAFITMEGGDAEQATDSQRRRRGLGVYAGRTVAAATLVATGFLAHDAYQNFQQPTEQQPTQTQIEHTVDNAP